MLSKISATISLFIACAVSVQAFSFEPISQDYTSSGKGSNHIFTVANTEDEKIAVKITIRPRFIEPDGTEVQGDESNLFKIYPRQIILNPNENRSVRVKWVGTAEPPEELSFRIIAEQVPVSFTEIQPIQGGQITLIYRYEGAIYIVPPGAKSRLSVKSIKREVENELNHEFLVLEVENIGNRHTILNNIEIKLKRNENDPTPIILKDDDLKGVAGANILAGSVRIFKILMPSEIWEGPVYGNIKQEPAK